MKFVTDMMGKIDDLSVRERAAVFIAVLAVIFFVWDSYLMSTLSNREKNLKTQLQQKQAEQTALNAELQVLISNRQTDPNAANKQKLESLRSELNEITTEVMESTKHLISPNRMAAVLENVLNKSGGLGLIEVKGLGSSALISTEKGKEKQSASADASSGSRENDGEVKLANAYKHGLKIVFKGSFMSTLEYVKDLESLDNEFIWDSLKLEIMEYPEGRASITVYTLSLDKNWIGT